MVHEDQLEDSRIKRECSKKEKKKEEGRWTKRVEESASFLFRKVGHDKIRVSRKRLVRENIQNFYFSSKSWQELLCFQRRQQRQDLASVLCLLSARSYSTKWRLSYRLRAKNRSERSPKEPVNNKKSKSYLEILVVLCFNSLTSLPERLPRAKSRSLLLIPAYESLRLYSIPYWTM